MMELVSLWQRSNRFLELIRFSHTIFAMPFALLASVWAWVVPSETASGPEVFFRWQDLLGVVLCMVTARSFAMAVNRLLDSEIDAANPRTAGRHLPRGLLGHREVTLFAIACAVGFIASCCLFLPNRFPLWLSLPVLLFLGSYSLGKRFTNFVHVWLGAALMLAPICAWLAIRGSIVEQSVTDILPAVGLGAVVLLWVAGFDIIYACQDAQFDRASGVYSIPGWLGISGALRVSQGLHLAMWCVAMGLTFWFPQLSLGWIFRVALIVVGGLLVYEHSVVSGKSLDRMQLAFFQLNSIISIVFLAFGGLDAFLR